MQSSDAKVKKTGKKGGVAGYDTSAHCTSLFGAIGLDITPFWIIAELIALAKRIAGCLEVRLGGSVTLAAAVGKLYVEMWSLKILRRPVLPITFCGRKIRETGIRASKNRVSPIISHESLSRGGKLEPQYGNIGSPHYE